MSAHAKPPKRLLIVDGYNIINALSEGAPTRDSLADARDRLLNDLINYAGYSGQQVVLVFDAWGSDRDRRTEEKHGPVKVVYTQKGEIADCYIERLCDELARDVEYRRVEVRVASSDALEQTIILGRGATRMSARELMYEMQKQRTDGSRYTAQTRPLGCRSAIGDHLPEDVRMKLDALRRGGRK